MKKIIIICIASLIAINANAQFALWHYGIIGGPSSTWLLNSNASNIGAQLNYKSTISGGFGVSLTRNFVEKIGVKLDLIYSMHNQKYGADVATNGSVIPYEAETKLSYLDIPIMLHVGKSNGFYFEVGPQFGFLMGAKDDMTFTDATYSAANWTDKDRKADFNSMNIAADIGFGYNFSVVKLLSIDIGLRFGYGLTDVTKQFTESDMATNDHGFTSNVAHYNSWIENASTFGYTSTSRLFGSLLIGATLQIP